MQIGQQMSQLYCSQEPGSGLIRRATRYTRHVTTDIAKLVPWLQPKAVVKLTGGWTYETYAIDDAWIVQVGRTNYAANTLRHQSRVLPMLANHLGSKIPS